MNSNENYDELENEISFGMYIYFIFLLIIFFVVFFVIFQFEVFYMYIIVFACFMSFFGIFIANNRHKIFKICSTITLFISILVIIYYYFFSNKIEPMLLLNNEYDINFSEIDVVSTSLYRHEFLFFKGTKRSATIISDGIEYYVYYNNLLKEWKVKSIMLEIKEYLLNKYSSDEFYNIKLVEEGNVKACFDMDGSCLWLNKNDAYYKVYSIYSKNENKYFTVTYTYDNGKVTIGDNFY